MLRKTISILIAGFIFQSLMSCDRNCNPGPTIEMVYTDLNLGLNSEVNDELTPIEDSVRKENFRLFISFLHEERQITHANVLLNFGLNTAKALDCGPDPIYPDYVEELSIMMINSEDSTQRKDATDLFVNKTESKNYNIEELIEIKSNVSEYDLFRLSLLEYDSIYQKASFSVTATLESGETFTQETEEIIFID
ncbi:hypothetical protein ABWH96_16360 [Marivirga tractuosa]|uniref:hypothetical protein n=1 Tax=Marivirga tractuosa TaxID=1006 RepID=UPI0035CEC021